jgi:hypothetical protein
LGSPATRFSTVNIRSFGLFAPGITVAASLARASSNSMFD